jgi:hypothetical protein
LFNNCIRDGTELLTALETPACPICNLGLRIRELVRSAAEDTLRETRLLCCRHLTLALGHAKTSRIKAKLARSSVILGSGANTGAKQECPICTSLEDAAASLQRAVQRLDGRGRFQKAIETGPLVCRNHRDQICSGNIAPYFARAQQVKLKRLAEELAQVERTGGLESYRVIAETLNYLRSRDQPCPSGEPVRDSGEAYQAFHRKVG